MSRLKPRHATLVDLLTESGSLIDSGLAIFMPGPASYTGEDTLELSLHGGRMITELALEIHHVCWRASRRARGIHAARL